MALPRFMERLRQRLAVRRGSRGTVSYAQCGEDLIVGYALRLLGVQRPLYLDIGAHHPSYLNNTKMFYDQGANGVNVEADPSLYQAFVRERPRDRNLNLGIGPQAARLPFYVMEPPTLNTFDRAAAEAAVAEGNGAIRIAREMEIPVVTFADLLREHLPRCPDFLSLDVEGMDLAILRSIDFTICRPKVICVETVTFSCSRRGQKISDIPQLLTEHGYFLYADTYVNSIFVDGTIWSS